VTDALRYTVAEYLTRWQEVKRTSAKLEGPSLADRLALCERDEPGFVEALLDGLGPAACLQLAYDWEFWGRPKQLAPCELERLGVLWTILLYMGGRGGGKTRPATEWIVSRLLAGAKIIVLVGPTEGEVVQFMLGGLKKRSQGGNGSGLFDVLPPWIRCEYLEDDGVIRFPDFGAEARIHSAQLPEYRGPEPDTIWGDEVLKWRYPKRLLDNLRLALRALGKIKPQMMLTTSPKKLAFLRDLVMDDEVVTIKSRTNENRGNVDENWLRGQQKRLAGTSQGEEELDGELGVDEAGALFPLATIDAHRVDEAPQLDLVGVGIDPAASTHRKSDDTGIVAAGRAGDIHTGHGYVLGDKTGRYTPEEWGDVAFDLVEDVGGSCFVVERNRVGDLAASNLRAAGARRTTRYVEARRRKGPPNPALPDNDGWRAVERKAGRSIAAGLDLVKLDPAGRVVRRIMIVEVLAMGDKATRAEPVSTLYQAGRMHHVGRIDMRAGKAGEQAGTGLETEMSEWDPGTGVSPNGLDGLVHVTVHLFGLDSAPVADTSQANRGYAAAVTAMQGAKPASTGGLQDLLGSLMRGHRGSRL
jgi:phage terminase large subunit-like protein